MSFIETYQTLVGTVIGSFLAILSSVFLWFLKGLYDKKKLIKDNRKEIDSIFFMAGRDSQESMMDLAHVIPKMREGVKKSSSATTLHVFTPPRLNRVHLNEDRLTHLRQGLDFATEQQVEIAVSSAKKFNGYMDHFESGPAFIFDSTIKLLNAGITSKDEVFNEYKKDMEKYLDNFEMMMTTHLETAQRNMLRPIVVQANKKRLKAFNKMRGEEMDDELNALAAFMLSAIKQDLA